MKAVIYARYSSDGQREESIEGQLRECTEYAEKNDMTVVGTYIDRALSASKNTEKRLEFQHMIRDSAKGHFDAVLVWKLDRFARKREDSALFKSILRKNGVKVISATERISDSSEGIILESLLEGLAEYYSAELAEKIGRGQKENALKGKFSGGGIPLGYKIDENQMIAVDPLTAPVVLEVFKRYAAGESILEIKKSLDERGIRNRYGKEIIKSCYTLMLRNRKYIGEYSYKGVIIPGGVPAIIPEDLFDRVQKNLEKNKHAPATAKADERYILATKLFCGECGTSMVGESGKSRNGTIHHYYKCGNAKRGQGCHKKAVKKEWIENVVIEQTVVKIFDDDLMERLINMLVALQGKENTDVAIIKKQLSEIEKGIENMLNAIQAGVLTSSTKQRLERLEEQKTDLEKALIQAQLANPVLSREQIAFYIYNFRTLDIAVPEHRQRLIDSFVNAVYVYDDKLIMTFNYKDSKKTISLDNIKSSDLVKRAPP